jgi:hypothetical protein
VSDAVVCDNCKRSTKPIGLVGWLTIDRHHAAVDATWFNETAPPFDFCSMRCAAEWTGKKADT